MYVAGVQLDIAWEDKAANHAKVRALVGAAKLPKGALVALPEMFATGFSMNVAEIAQTDARETETFLAALGEGARDLSSAAASVVRAADGRGSTSRSRSRPDGALVARYSKIHPFSYGGETEQYAAGDGDPHLSRSDRSRSRRSSATTCVSPRSSATR